MASNILQTGAGIPGPRAERNSVTPAVKQPPFYGFVKRATRVPARIHLAGAQRVVWINHYEVWAPEWMVDYVLRTEAALDRAWDREDDWKERATVACCALAAMAAVVVLDLMI